MREIINVLRFIYARTAVVIALLQQIVQLLTVIASRLESPPPSVPTSIRWTVGQPTSED